MSFFNSDVCLKLVGKIWSRSNTRTKMRKTFLMKNRFAKNTLFFSFLFFSQIYLSRFAFILCQIFIFSIGLFFARCYSFVDILYYLFNPSSIYYNLCIHRSRKDLRLSPSWIYSS